MKRLKVLALCVVYAMPSAASPVVVHKCMDTGGGVVYQSAPCPRTMRMLARWDAPPDPVRPLVDRATRRTPPIGRDTRHRPRRWKISVPARTVDACAAAKARREQIERRVGLARTYDMLSALDRDVFDACR